ncbi:YlbL family protein [Nocardioides pacificus]
MNQRTLAAIVAAPLVIGLWVCAFVLPLPYVTYQPGPTVDVLAETDGEEIIEVTGHETYQSDDGSDGELRMTTVSVTRVGDRVSLVDAMLAWFDEDEAVYPYDSVYAPDETPESSRRESAVQMVTSQDTATAVALTELGYDLEPALRVSGVSEGMPADGVLEVRDILLEVEGEPIKNGDEVVAAVNGADGEPVELKIRRGGEDRTVEVTPREVEGKPLIGIEMGVGYRFPFDVEVNIPDQIGGPSAGLMFSLAIYDSLTPGSLTGGRIVAGTGTVDAEGAVGPIGGIQQKIVGAREAGAELFLVPPANCADALGAPADGIRLVRAETMHDAREAIEAWAEDADADLPTCTEES